MARTSFRSVDEYIAAQPPAARAVLTRVRSAIQEALPGAEEVISYQIPVGDGVNSLSAIKGQWVRVTPHLRTSSDYQSNVGDACDPSTGTGWCADLPRPTVANGILTTEDEAQAKARLDKGAEAVRVAVEMAKLKGRLA